MGNWKVEATEEKHYLTKQNTLGESGDRKERNAKIAQRANGLESQIF